MTDLVAGPIIAEAVAAEQQILAARVELGFVRLMLQPKLLGVKLGLPSWDKDAGRILRDHQAKNSLIGQLTKPISLGTS